MPHNAMEAPAVTFEHETSFSQHWLSAGSGAQLSLTTYPRLRYPS